MTERQRKIAKRLEVETRIVATLKEVLAAQDSFGDCYPLAKDAPLKMPFKREYDDGGEEINKKIEQIINLVEEVREANLNSLSDIIREPHIQQ